MISFLRCERCGVPGHQSEVVLEGGYALCWPCVGFAPQSGEYAVAWQYERDLDEYVLQLWLEAI